MIRTMPAEPDPLEDALNSVVDATPVIDPVDMDPKTLQCFIDDIAQAIFPPVTIARRYGLAPAAMVRFIRDTAEVRRRIKVRRAIWESDDSVDARVRKLAGHAVLEALPSTAQIMMDGTVPNGTRLDALKAHARMAGVDGLPASARDGSAPPGSNFTFTINFTGAGKKQTIEGTTVVQDALPEPEVTPEPAP